jgi:hypothetical protein
VLVKARLGSLIVEVGIFGCKRLVSGEMNLNTEVLGRNGARIWKCRRVERYEGTEFGDNIERLGQ